jgi:hypothetical protein
MSKPLAKIKFHSIARDIKEATGGVQGLKVVPLSAIAKRSIAKKHGVSIETVRLVNVHKTWPKFSDYKIKQQLDAKNKKNSTRAKADAVKRSATRALDKVVTSANISPTTSTSVTHQELRLLERRIAQLEKDSIRHEIELNKRARHSFTLFGGKR